MATKEPSVPSLPASAAAIDDLGQWLTHVDAYLRAIEQLEPKLAVAEQAYGRNLEAAVKAITLIPGSGESVYDPEPVEAGYYFMDGGVWHDVRRENVSIENRNVDPKKTDVMVALDQLAAQYPELEHVSLVVSWFGTDLRAEHCELLPGAEWTETKKYSQGFLGWGGSIRVPVKVTNPVWTVAGLKREQSGVHQISRDFEGRANYGGTPSDGSVKRLIAELKRRKWKVTFYPFILMDIVAGNGRPDPYGGPEQGAFPWRGRITCHPAPGQPGSVDRTAAARSQVEAFVSQYRRFILHYANLCRDAGGVDAFLIGSELRGLTWVRDEHDDHPFVNALITLAADVKTVLGATTKVSYAADWSEFVAYQTPDGQLDFHLDPLWASPHIDAVSIDNYWPLSDWRGVFGIDEEKWPNIYDPAYLASNIEGGEGYDWHYASEADRIAQVRTPISDGLGKPWVFRYKDIRNWWLNRHYNRPAGMATEKLQPTPWVPQSKPIWFTELGCPAVDKGSNQPNVFIDPKSAESFAPYFSTAVRDDLIQRRHIAAVLTWYANDARNPASILYQGRLVDTSRIYIYTWDARPYPAFPERIDVWSDGPNWERGHWITGRQIDFPPPPAEEIPPTEVIDLMPAKPMPKGEPAVDPKTGRLTPSMHHYLAQIEEIAKRLQRLRIVAIREEQRT